MLRKIFMLKRILDTTRLTLVNQNASVQSTINSKQKEKGRLERSATDGAQDIEVLRLIYTLFYYKGTEK